MAEYMVDVTVTLVVNTDDINEAWKEGEAWIEDLDSSDSAKIEREDVMSVDEV